MRDAMGKARAPRTEPPRGKSHDAYETITVQQIHSSNDPPTHRKEGRKERREGGRTDKYMLQVLEQYAATHPGHTSEISWASPRKMGVPNLLSLQVSSFTLQGI